MRLPRRAQAHALVGWVAFFAVAATGWYMRRHDPAMDELERGLRMLFRSRHIYLLAAALVNGALGLARFEGHLRWLSLVGSILVLAAPLLLLGAFVLETGSFGGPSGLSPFGIQVLAIGVALLLVASWIRSER